MIPTVGEERAIALARRYPQFASRLTTPWRSQGPLVRIVFFILTSVAVVALYLFFDLLQLPAGWLTGACAIAAAEFLIGRLRFLATGVESALWIGGLYAIIFGLQYQSRPEGVLLFAAAAIIAAARLRNPWLATLGVVLSFVYFAVRYLHGIALACSIVVELVAVVALSRDVKRPSSEKALSLLAMAMPVAGSLAGPPLRPGWGLAWILAGALLFARAVRLRHRALLIAAAVSIVVGAIRVHTLIHLEDEWKLMVAGAILLAAAGLFSRLLKGRTTGIVSTPTDRDDALEILGTVQLSPVPHPIASREDGGGSFGGAGSSGEF